MRIPSFPPAVRDRIRDWPLVAVALLVLAGIVVASPPERPTTAAAPYPAPVMTGYVPLEANATRQTMLSANSEAGSTLDFTVGITNAGAGAVMFYDHWEDGYEADITNPVQPSTQVWGDGDATGGDAATYCGTRCAGDLLPAGAVFVLRNNISIPRTTTVLFDGRDRISSTRGFSITAGGFSTPLGSVLSASASAYDTSKWGKDYWIPVGEDMTPPAGTSDAFSTTSVQVMADQPDTLVEVDKDGDGDIDVSETIGAGAVTFVDGGVNRGARVHASKPVQVHVGAGEAGASYELRWFTLFPTALLTPDYVNPVGSTSDNQRTITYLFNPNPSAITVTPTCAGCSGSLTVAASDGASYASPLGMAVRFASNGGEPFVAVGAAGSESGALPGSAVDRSANYDWGFGLVPTRLLTSKAVLGWAPGNSNNPPATPAGNRDDDPVWITSLGDTTLYVDFDGDPATGLGEECDGRYDQALTVTEGASTKIFDNADGDMTGASIYTCDGTLIAGAWGEDAANAPAGSPGFDAGYALIPSTAMVVNKTSALGQDTNGDGRFGPGDVVQYDISIADAGALSFTDLSVADAIPDGTTYVPNSTTYDDGMGGGDAPFADDVTPPAATPYPFDEDGAELPTIRPGTTVHLKYQVAIQDPFPVGTSIVNVVDVGAEQAGGGDTDLIQLVDADLSLDKVVTTTPTHLGEDATFRLTVANAGPDGAEDVEVTDLLPAELAYVSSTPSAGTYDEDSGVWEVGDLAADTSATLDITATVNALSVTNTAEITHSLAADPDSSPANGSTTEDDDASAALTVQPLADVSLTKQRISGPDADGNTTFVLTAANSGPNTSAGVDVTDHPPAGAVFVSATPQTSSVADGTFDGSSDVWSVPDLAPGGQAQTNVVYDTSAGPGTNYAQVTAATIDDPDSNPDTAPLSDTNPPDQDDEAAAVAPAISDVSVTNVVTTAPTNVGDLVTFTVTVRNDGPNATSGVAVTDRLPAGLVFVSAAASVGDYDPFTGVWSVGDLSDDAEEVLEIVARVMTPGALSTTAELTSSTVPDVDSTPNNAIASEDDQASAAVTTTGAGLGDIVWFDVDNDFDLDAGEPGLGEVVVDAVWTNPDGGSDVTYTTTTGADGAWSLTGLPHGSYVVSIDPSTLPFGVTVPTGDRDGAGTPHAATFTLNGGETLDDVDFAYTGSGLVGDAVFLDADGDGQPDTGEGIEGVRVMLTSFGPDGSASGDDISFQTVTDEFGGYAFANLPAGDFSVTIDAASLPRGLTNTVDPDGGDTDTAQVTLATGEQRLDLDFGYAGDNAIGDTVFADTDGSGGQDDGEVGLGGVGVVLLRDVDLDGSFETSVATTTTSGTGTYLFDRLPAGSYQVAVTVPSGLVTTTPATIDVTVDDGEIVDTADFGLRSPASGPGSIGDLVWDDLDADGVVDDGEPGIAGAELTLRADADGDGVFETVLATQTSGPDGAYAFDNLPAGAYQVAVTPPPARFPTTVVVYTVDLTAGATFDAADFGLATTRNDTGSIGDLVWSDDDGDGGRDDGEAGLADVTVTLRRDSDADGVFETVIGSTDTGSGGAYAFDGLSAGSYRAVVTIPDGRSSTTPAAVDIGLAAGERVETVDFGLAVTPPSTGTIGDRIWLDVDGDGEQDPSEPGVNGVEVSLFADLDGDGAYETSVDAATTFGDGNYRFSDVAPGAYRVVVTPPDGLSVTTPAPTVTLAPGATIDTADIGLGATPPAPYDLAIDKEADGTAGSGGTVTWTLTAINDTTVATPGDVRVVDDLPSGLTYVSAGGAGWTCSATGRVVTCEHAEPLAASSSSAIELVTRISASPGTSITNTATVSASGGEITTTNNVASDAIVVAPDPTTPTTAVPVTKPTDPTTAPTTSATGPTTQGSGQAEPPTPPTPPTTTTTTTTPTPDGDLPRTGGSPMSIVRLAALVMVLGAGLVVIVFGSRRRRPT